LLEAGVPRHDALHGQHLLPCARAECDAVGTGRGLQRPERAGIVRIGIAVGHVRRALLLDQSAAAGEQLQDAGDDLVQHSACSASSVGYLDEDRLAFGAAPVDAVQHQAVKVDVQVGGRAEALDQRDGTAVGLVCLQPSLLEQVAREQAVHNLQHRRQQLRRSRRQEKGRASARPAVPLVRRR
jgi:hypothetical protein